MKCRSQFPALAALLLLASGGARGQFVLSKEQMVAYTASNMPGDVVLGDEEGLLFIPPHLVKASIDAAAGTKARDEWIKMKMDTRQYKSSDLYGTPRDPALRKEMDDYIKAHQPPKQN